MADPRLPDLTEATTFADDDLFYMVAVGDASDWPSGSAKKIKGSNLAAGINVANGLELNFGSVPVSSKKFTVLHPALTASSRVFFTPSGFPATDRVGNDFEWDAIQLSAVPTTASMDVYATVLNGHVRGWRAFFFTISS